LIDAVLSLAGGVYARVDVYNNLFRYRAHTSRPSAQPTECFYDPQFPLGNIYVYPTPDATYTMELTALTSLAPFAAGTDTINLPPEYQLTLAANLAAHMLPTFGKTDPLLVEKAERAKVELAANNARRFVRLNCPHPWLARNHFCASANQARLPEDQK
jgi:hypothetical protein